jgi:DNA polymerase
VNARDQLRAFLEQRRELGETEFVLESLQLDDVLKVLGAAGAPPSATARPVEAKPEPRRDTGPRVVPGPPPSDPGAPRGNWREELRAAGGAPASQDRPVESSEPVPAAKVARAEGVATPRAAIARPEPAAIPVTDPSNDAPLEISSLPAGLSVGMAAGGDSAAEESPYQSLDDIARAVAGCTRCALAVGAKNPVPGHGNPKAEFVCVGEAPGANEDEQGLPFVGASGQLLTKILAAINLSRDDVFICNVLKHRPPGNRNPSPEEVHVCSPYLVRQIELIRPRVILALGTFAAQTLLQTKEPIGKLRGRLHRYYGVPVIVTYHPAALLRNPSWKRPTWEDVQLARKFLDRVVEA